MTRVPRALALCLALCLVAPVPTGWAKTAKPAAPAAPARDPNAQSLMEFFKDEELKSAKNLDFKIIGGYADIHTDSAQSSGRYFLAGQNIAAVAPDIYRLDLTFKHKYQRDIIDYNPEYFFTQQRSYYFWYNGGKRLVFKLGSGKKTFDTSKKEITQIKVQSLETYTVERQKLLINLQFKDAGTSVTLEIQFL
ncbi:hypothetical protein JCM15519_24810 [Fundidesulfovibrio butyratiphilus]